MSADLGAYNLRTTYVQPTMHNIPAVREGGAGLECWLTARRWEGLVESSAAVSMASGAGQISEPQANTTVDFCFLGCFCLWGSNLCTPSSL
jgi:hypothetical protein